MRRVEHVACVEDLRNSWRNFVGKPEGKRPLGRSRRKWEENVQMNVI